jgi:hypothetical protein
MLPLQSFYIFDLESLDVQIIETEQRYRILHVEAKRESLHKIFTFLQRSWVGCVLGGP